MKGQQGFGAIVAIVILVILAVMAAAIISISTSQQVTSAQDLLSARVWQAARAGDEWGLYQSLKNSSCIGGAGTTLDLSADTGAHVTVICDAWVYNEGETVPGTAKIVTVYRITATACTSAACPDSTAAVASAGYIERTRVVLATN